MRRKSFAGKPLFAAAVVGLTAHEFVHRSASGLPSASVSNGTLGGRLVPRKRMYCDAVTFGILKLITLTPESRLRVAHVSLLNVLMTAALVFFAAAGTVARLGVPPFI